MKTSLLGIFRLTFPLLIFSPSFALSAASDQPFFNELQRPSGFQMENFVKRNRFVSINPRALQGFYQTHFRPNSPPRLHLNLFKNENFTMVLDHPHVRPKGRMVAKEFIHRYNACGLDFQKYVNGINMKSFKGIDGGETRNSFYVDFKHLLRNAEFNLEVHHPGERPPQEFGIRGISWDGG